MKKNTNKKYFNISIKLVIVILLSYVIYQQVFAKENAEEINNLALSIQSRYLEICGIQTSMPEDGYHGPEIIEAARKMYEEFGNEYVGNDDAIEFFKKTGVDNLLIELKKDLDDFRVGFDVWFSEKSLYENNEVEKTIEFLKNNNFITFKVL